MTQPGTDERVPLTFKLVVGATAAYLLLRLVQGVAWFIDWIR